MRLLALALLLSALNVQPSSGSELSVDKRTLTMDDRLSISLALDGPFTDLDDVAIPLQNLTIESGPSSRVEYSWVNGNAAYRKTLVYIARAKAPGAALVGPLVLHGKNGAVETLAPLSVQVVPDTTGGSNDPLTIARELVSTHRDPIFVVAAADKGEAFVGEPIIVTWMLYNATSLQRFGINDLPRLDDFWVEEIPIRDPSPELVTLGELQMQRVPIRRAAIYPLRSGTLTVGSLSITAETVRRIGMDRFGIPLEGMLAEIDRRAPELAITSRPLPPGPPVSAVGDVTLACEALPKTTSGPIALTAAMTGRANLRAATAPAFEHPVDGSVRLMDAGVSVDRRSDDVVMTRRWRYVIFPARSGRLTIPALEAIELMPSGERRTLRCAVQTIEAAASIPPAMVRGDAARQIETTERARQVWPWVAGGLGALFVLGGALRRLRHARAERAEVRVILRPAPAETREALHAWLAARGLDPGALLLERSDRGDAVRALHSLLDATERDRIVFSTAEARHRIRDVVETCAMHERMAQSKTQSSFKQEKNP
jgi:hypothetical protein